jgi:serine/threonine protein phosphatase PrpC
MWNVWPNALRCGLWLVKDRLFSGVQSRLHMILASGLSDIGCKRSANEDRILVEPGLQLFVVADGMGGERCGSRAAELAMTALRDYFQFTQTMDSNGSRTVRADSLEDAQGKMAAAIRLANERILQESMMAEECRGMGCTVSAVTIKENVATIGSVGDSRVYLFRKGQLIQLTNDDSVVGKLVRSGKITSEEACSHPMRNLLTQSVGNKETIEIQITDLPLLSEDRLLLSSDGLHGIVGDKALRDILSAGHDPEITSRQLIAEARARRGSDNVSCIVVDCRSQAGA